jgi:L-galactose dehydrogenase
MMLSTDTELMEYRQLGGTDLTVSIIGFGASPLGNVFGKIDASGVKRTVHLAIDCGVNFFDVFPYYGITLAEKRLGTALNGKRHQVVLATKCGRYGLDQFDFSAKRVFSSVEESLRRLKTDYVDLLQVHDIEFGDLQQIIEETVPALRRIQEQGKARFVGITGYPLKALCRVAEAVPVDTILTYCRYNLMVTDMEDILMPLAKARGIGVINASSLHMGVLTEDGAPDWHPAPEPVREAGRRAAALCRERGTDIASVAVRFSLDNPDIASTLVGMSSSTHVQSNLNLLRAANDPELVAELRTILAPVLNYVWPSGKPENHD